MITLRQEEIEEEIKELEKEQMEVSPDTWDYAEEFDNHIDRNCGDIEIYGNRYNASKILYLLDRRDYDNELQNYCDEKPLEELKEYQDIQESINRLQEEYDTIAERIRIEELEQGEQNEQNNNGTTGI